MFQDSRYTPNMHSATQKYKKCGLPEGKWGTPVSRSTDVEFQRATWDSPHDVAILAGSVERTRLGHRDAVR